MIPINQHNLDSESSLVNLSLKDKYYFKLSLYLAENGLKDNEVPVGCVLVYNDEIIGRGTNKVNKLVNYSFL